MVAQSTRELTPQTWLCSASSGQCLSDRPSWIRVTELLKQVTFAVQMTGTIIGALLNCTQYLTSLVWKQLTGVLADVIMQTVVRNERTILVRCHVTV